MWHAARLEKAPVFIHFLPCSFHLENENCSHLFIPITKHQAASANSHMLGPQRHAVVQRAGTGAGSRYVKECLHREHLDISFAFADGVSDWRDSKASVRQAHRAGQVSQRTHENTTGTTRQRAALEHLWKRACQAAEKPCFVKAFLSYQFERKLSIYTML